MKNMQNTKELFMLLSACTNNKLDLLTQTLASRVVESDIYKECLQYKGVYIPAKEALLKMNMNQIRQLMSALELLPMTVVLLHQAICSASISNLEKLIPPDFSNPESLEGFASSLRGILPYRTGAGNYTNFSRDEAFLFFDKNTVKHMDSARILPPRKLGDSENDNLKKILSNRYFCVEAADYNAYIQRAGVEKEQRDSRRGPIAAMLTLGACSAVYTFLLLRFVPFAIANNMNGGNIAGWDWWQQTLYIAGPLVIYSLAAALCAQITNSERTHRVIRLFQFAGAAALVLQIVRSNSAANGIGIIILGSVTCVVLILPGLLLRRAAPSSTPGKVRKYTAIILAAGLMLGSLYYWIWLDPAHLGIADTFAFNLAGRSADVSEAINNGDFVAAEATILKINNDAKREELYISALTAMGQSAKYTTSELLVAERMLLSIKDLSIIKSTLAAMPNADFSNRLAYLLNKNFISTGISCTMALKQDGNIKIGAVQSNYSTGKLSLLEAQDTTSGNSFVMVATYGGYSYAFGTDGGLYIGNQGITGKVHTSTAMISLMGASDAYCINRDGTVSCCLVGEATGDATITAWNDVVSADLTGYSVALKSDGTVLSKGELDVSQWSGVIDVSSGANYPGTELDNADKSFVVGLKLDGTVVAAGNNDFGQINVGSWTDIVAVSAGSGETVGLKSDGTVVAAGNNDYGQLNVSDWTDIVAVAAGRGFTIGLKSDGTLVSAGTYEYSMVDVSGWDNIMFYPIKTSG